MSQPPPFSRQLQTWLRRSKNHTIAGIIDVFADRSFAILIFLLMFLPAMPIPTGGFSHVFEIIVMLLAGQMIVGQKEIWLPARWRTYSLGGLTTKKVLPHLIRVLAWFEKHSRQRFIKLMQYRHTDNFIGLAILIFTLAAFLAPPFSGLDTIPSIAVELLALSIILRDGLFIVAGLVVGSLGIVAIVGVSSLLVKLIRSF